MLKMLIVNIVVCKNAGDSASYEAPEIILIPYSGCDL